MADLSSTERESDAYTPSKRSTPLREVLSPLVVQALPTQEPGMFPSEVASKLLQDSSQLPQSVDSTNLTTQVRIILLANYELGRVTRVDAKGPKGGKSHQYVRCDSSGHDSEVGVNERVPQPSPDIAFGSGDQVGHSDGTHVDETTLSHRQPIGASHMTQDSQQAPRIGSNTESDRLELSFDTSVSQNEQGGPWRTLNSPSEARYEKHECRDLMEKVRATKELIAHHEKVTGEITVLESQQTLARSQYSELDDQVREKEIARAGLLAEAQTWRDQAAEAERKALSHQNDAERLKKEAEEPKGVLEASEIRIARAREESILLAERVRRAVQETYGDDLVSLLSLCKRDAQT